MVCQGKSRNQSKKIFMNSKMDLRRRVQRGGKRVDGQEKGTGVCPIFTMGGEKGGHAEKDRYWGGNSWTQSWREKIVAGGRRREETFVSPANPS